MRTEEQPERTRSAGEEDLSVINRGAAALAELSRRIAPRFRRAEVRSRVGRYLRGLLAPVERKNGWQLAEALGDSNAHGVQRLSAEADWEEAARSADLRAHVIEQSREASRILAVDKTGFLKKRKKSARV